MTPTRAWFRALLTIAVLAATVGCTDAATRVANDLESGAKRLRASNEQSLVVDHAPKATPDGCPRGYTLQLSEASSLLVWCQDSLEGPSVSSHTTTYHLNFVTVPKTLIIHKGPGEHAFIELDKSGNDVAVVAVR